MPWLLTKSYPLSDRVVAASSGVARDVAQILAWQEERIPVIYNPAFTPTLVRKSLEPIDHIWFQPDEPPVILGVGRLTAQKDFATLVKAFRIVRDQREARLMILGRGEDRPDLERLVAELDLERDVALPGFAANPFAYMRNAAVFALSSRWEGFGNVLVEALACQCPVVSTDCPNGPSEILEGGKWGHLVPVGDAEALADAIERQLNHPNHASTETLKRFSTETIVDRYYRLLMEDETDVRYAS